MCPRTAALTARPERGGPCVVAPALLRRDEAAAFAAADYRQVASNELAAVWMPADAARGAVRHALPEETVCGFGGLRSPHGLGVYGGKAQLLLRVGGVPTGFWTDPAYAVYQPSYPPGMTLLALLVFLLSGVSDHGLVGCIVPAALVSLFFLLGGRGAGWIRRLAAALYVTCPLALHMGAGFYAEPCAALCLVGGLALLARGRTHLGWWVIGGAALFRHEALLLAGLLWCAERLRAGRCAVPVATAVAALLPGIAWQAFIAVCGATVYDFDFAQLPASARVAEAVGAMVRQLTVGCGEIGGGALLAAALGAWTGYSDVRARSFAVFAFLMVGALLLGFCVSPHFGWILRNTLPRTVWLATSALLATGRARADFV